MPTVEAEEWRYSRIAELDVARYGAASSEAAAGEVPAAASSMVAALGDLAGVVVLVDGAVAIVELGSDASASGVGFGSSHDDGIDAADVLGDAPSHPVDLFDVWNDV